MNDFKNDCKELKHQCTDFYEGIVGLKQYGILILVPILSLLGLVILIVTTLLK